MGGTCGSLKRASCRNRPANEAVNISGADRVAFSGEVVRNIRTSAAVARATRPAFWGWGQSGALPTQARATKFDAVGLEPTTCTQKRGKQRRRTHVELAAALFSKAASRAPRAQSWRRFRSAPAKIHR